MIDLAKANAAQPDHAALIAAQGELTAYRAVAFAAEKLGERQSIFSAADLEKEAGRFGLGKVSAAQTGAAIARSSRDGELVPRTYLDRRGAEFAGFTTATNIENERRLLRAEAMGRGAVKPILSPAQAAKAVARAVLQSEHRWNPGQREATKSLLTSTNRVTALQGYAGTAKTTTVLATLASEATARGLRVSPLAPTASAARTLGDALDMKGETVAKHLMGQTRMQRGGMWIVDEASLLSARDMAALLDHAGKASARVVLVGDVKQLGSVGAGAAFAQLQSAGMETAKLDEIVRQNNAATKDAVLASIEGDARKAIAALEGGGGRIMESPDRADRFAAIAKHYAQLDNAARAKTLVIEPSREGRDALTADIRAELAKAGALTGPAVTMQSLVSKGLSRAEARDPMSYEMGDAVRFTRDYADKGVSRGETYCVAGIDPAKSAIALKGQDGREIDWRLRQWGAGKVEVFTTQALELKAGDRIQFTRNDGELGRINGGRGTVSAIDKQSRSATILNPRGQIQTLNLDATRDQHIRHAYVETVFAAQGRTSDHVIIHADSKATNLIDQKSFYVSVSRARELIEIYTNDRAKLVTAINERAGLAQTAVSEAAMAAPAAGKSLGAGLG